jgi:hypothetical protein
MGRISHTNLKIRMVIYRIETSKNHTENYMYMLHPASTQIQCAHWTCLCPVSTLDSPVYTLDINMSSVHTGINADAQ